MCNEINKEYLIEIIKGLDEIIRKQVPTWKERAYPAHVKALEVLSGL
jgi:hypothetical protein